MLLSSSLIPELSFLTLLCTSLVYGGPIIEDDFSGSGELPDYCDLSQCAPANREDQPPTWRPTTITGLPTDCSLDCSNSVYPSACTPCSAFTQPVFPNGPLYLVMVPQSTVTHGFDGSLAVNVSNATSGALLLQQTSRVVTVSGRDGYFIPINITGLECSELLVHYSLSPNVLDEGHICLNYSSPAITNVTYAFQSVCTDGDYTSAAITVYWSVSDDSSWFQGYNVTLIGEGEFFITELLSKNNSSFTFSNGPELNKEYSVIVTPYPAGFGRTLEVNTNLDSPVVHSDCSLILDPETFKHSFLFSWTITNYDCSVANRINEFKLRLIQYSYTTDNWGTIKEEFNLPSVNSSSKSTYLSVYHNISFISGTGFEMTLTTLFHGKIPLYSTKFNQIKCSKRLEALPPTVVMATNVTNFTHYHDDTVTITISWTPPERINGPNLVYNLWVGSVPLPLNSTLPVGQTLNDEIVFSQNINGTLKSLTLERIRVYTYPVMYIQLMSTNDFCMMTTPSCYSNWSEPLEYEISLPLSVPHTTAITSVDTAPYITATSTHSEIIHLATPSNAPDSTNLARIIPPLVGVVGGLFVIVVVLVVVVTCCCCFGGKLLKRDIPMDPMIKMSDPKWGGNGVDIQNKEKMLYVSYPPSFQLEEWEIPRDLLEVHENDVLGSGCFGEVFKGSLRMQYVLKKKRLSHVHQLHHKLPNVKQKEWLPVAVKKLKRTADGKEKADFLKEIDTMIKVAETESELKRFVVNTLGCCRLHEPILLAIEYVSCGDLLHYLRAEKKKMQGDTKEPFTLPAPYLEPVNEYSHLESQSGIADLEGNLNSKHLLDFSRQIAAGMEFLSGLGIVHRDLACRNILVNADRTLKISDFGLARTLLQDEVYTLTNHGRFPLRWMALESVFQREFTSASDVWSFGVVLWEICTMGKFPYGALSEKELLQRMKTGYRLEQPENCSQEIYELMHRCWHPSPTKRPKFSDLHKLLDLYLTKHTQDKYPYIDMDSNEPYTFDQLVPKSLFDYQTHMKEVLTIEDIETTGKDGRDTPPIVYIDNKMDTDTPTVSTCTFNDSDSAGEGGVSPNVSPTGKPPTLGGHVGLYRLQDNTGNDGQLVQPYDQLRLLDEQTMYNKEELLDTLNSIYMAAATDHLMVDPDDYYYQDEIWRKKLSTITEASNEMEY